MQMQIHVKGLVRASRLRVVAANKLNVTLARFSHAVQEVTMRMHDINGPERGGADKLCRVVLRLKDNSVLVIEDLGVNMMEVIDRVADRLHHTVARQLSRLARVERAGIRQSSLLAAAA
jgi:ribosome-associated translation inhibitor RaiA